MPEQENIEQKEEKQVPFGVTSFEELEEIQNAVDITREVSALTVNFQDLTWNIMQSSAIDTADKPMAIRQLAGAFVDRLEVMTRGDAVRERDLKEFEKANKPGLVDKIKSVMNKDAYQKTNWLIYKDQGGTNRFVARYSNNFRDDDMPPEIISSKSHKQFEALVDAGLVEPPELWIWHEKLLKIGQSDWVAYDDEGFALAGGYFLEGTNELVEQLKQLDDLAMSHGMPKWSLRRDSIDKSIIISHITKEISLLPKWAAANKRTGFIILDEDDVKEDKMAISQEKRDKLVTEWSIDPYLIEQIELQNSKTAANAVAEGVEAKEAVEEVVEETVETEPASEEVAEEAPEETPAETEPEVAEEAPEFVQGALNELAKAMQDTMKGVIAISERLNGLEAEVKELRATDEKKVAEKAAWTPMASLAELMNHSVVGKEEARVDGRTVLGKDAPEEAQPEVESRTGIPFIDAMIGGDAHS